MADTTLPFELDGLPFLAEAAREDSALLEALREGVPEAYETLIRRFQQPVYSLVYRLLDNPADAADVVQEVFLKVFRNIHSFRGSASLKTWIYRISFNEAYNQRRWFSRHRRQEVGLEASDDEALSLGESLSDNSPSAFDLVCGQETHALIEEALAELNPSFRAAVVLREIEELSYEEIAEVLQVSLGTVKSRIVRGREALKRAVSARLESRKLCPLALEAAR